ncbi:MAG: GNAT family N-acetyltransferase [Desulfobacterales bacterium]|nr:GNAT family N-acetyltransferase [Desulfobacterales bacterium]
MYTGVLALPLIYGITDNFKQLESLYEVLKEIDVRHVYIPDSETYVFTRATKIIGFYSLYENILAAIFVLPEFQGKGIGSQLIEHTKTQRNQIELSVYKDNEYSYNFYKSHDFKFICEQQDEHTGFMEITMGWSK